jgi:RNA polymerase sigma factor (sigma-70 family)
VSSASTLLASWRPALIAISRRYSSPTQDLADLLAAAQLGLLEAHARADPARPDAFHAFALNHIRKALQRWIRRSEAIVMETEHEIRQHKAAGTERRASEWSEEEDQEDATPVKRAPWPLWQQALARREQAMQVPVIELVVRCQERRVCYERASTSWRRKAA